MANEKRLIDVSTIITDLTAMKSMYDAISLDGMIKALNDAPTVDAVEVVHGHWIECEGTVCSVCNKHFFTDGPWAVANCRANYCPNCGAKMDGGNEDE